MTGLSISQQSFPKKRLKIFISFFLSSFVRLMLLSGEESEVVEEVGKLSSRFAPAFFTLL